LRKEGEQEDVFRVSVRLGVIFMEVKILKEEKGELTFELAGADQSFPQLLVEKLNADKSVEFAACKVSHPLVANPIVIVRSAKGKPSDAVVKALKELSEELGSFRKKFSDLVG
jgi:DNA-directed RNA polymerase subunit L